MYNPQKRFVQKGFEGEE